MARRARTVGCQSKSQGSRYRLGLIVYDIIAVQIFDQYRSIVLSIRALDSLHGFKTGLKTYVFRQDYN